MKTNKPVAWMLVDASWNDFCRYSSYPSEGAIPLYTHPVKEKGLPLSSPSPMNQAYLTRSDNNTPIAWTCWSEGMQAAIVTTTEPDMYGWQSIIPLFSHPVKELTDEEIKELAMEYLENTGKGIVGVYDFVRAILQKANNG